jgi:hypothetical protein
MQKKMLQMKVKKRKDFADIVCLFSLFCIVIILLIQINKKKLYNIYLYIGIVQKYKINILYNLLILKNI